jgi:Restriction endonuclease
VTTRKARRSRSTKTAHEKGTELEQAIGAIERTILQANPALSDKSYTIDFRKIIVVEGVKHEIDVWIQFDLGGGYKPTFIFEAKNWSKTVGKELIPDFSAKIAAANAQMGYFVAKSFSSYARAAAKRDTRIILLKANDEFITSDRVRHFHVTHQDLSKSKHQIVLVLKPDLAKAPPPPTVNMEAVSLTLNGVAISHAELAQRLVARVIQEHSLIVPSHTLAAGEYPFELVQEVVIAPDVLFAGVYEVEKISIQLHYVFEVVRARIVSKFDIETRGRSHVFEGFPIGPLGLQHVTIVERPDGAIAFLVTNEPPT